MRVEKKEMKNKWKQERKMSTYEREKKRRKGNKS